MYSTSQSPKIIHFPGGSGQRRQANYLIVAGPLGTHGLVLDTKIIFIEDQNDPAKSDPGWETILSKDFDSSIIPSYLVNKVLVQELSGCRLDYIEVYFVAEPNATKQREVYCWDFNVDVDNPIGDDPFRSTFRSYFSRWDQIKALFRIPGAAFETKGLTDGVNQRAGIYSVQVDINEPVLAEVDRLDILMAVDSAFRSL